MTRRPLAFAATLVILATVGWGPPGLVNAGPDPKGTPLVRTGLMAAVERLRAKGPAHWTTDQVRTVGFEVLGHEDLGGRGFNADVWAHGEFAYVGGWGHQTTACPAGGVAVVDVSDPTAPSWVATLQNPTLTTSEDVVVRRVQTPSFTGDLAVVGIQACGGFEPVFRGLQFFDVTDPYAPVELGRWDALFPTIGCHEVDLVARPDGRVLAGCATPFAEHYDAGEPVALVDATDPTSPFKVSSYYDTLQRGVGCTSSFLAHSVRFAGGGRRLYVSYWDSGTVELDVSNPASPQLVARSEIAPPHEDGDSHSLTEVGGRWLIVNPEDTSPDGCGDLFGGWGQAFLFERRNGPTTLRGTFSTPNSESTRTDGIYTVHNTEVWSGRQAFSSWYSDGIVWWEFSRTGQTRQRGQFVPTAAEDPYGYWPTVPLVWGVALQQERNLILASDINGGLWVLRPVAT